MTRHRTAISLAALGLLAVTVQAGPARPIRPLQPSPAPRATRIFRGPLGAPPPRTPPAVVQLVRRMLVAQNNLALTGTLVTQTPQGDFVQRAFLNGAQAQRYECLSPAQNRGEVIVDNGKSRFHSLPNGAVDVQPSQANSRRVQVPQIINSIRQGGLLAQAVGQGVVAGHACTVVRVGPPYAADWYQYWIDPATGAQLRIEQYDAAGQRLSASYFTGVTYNPPLDKHLFDPLRRASAAPASKPRPARQLTVPGADQAGFTVLQPSSLPPGFRFQSATVSDRPAGKPGRLVQLTYSNGLNALSLFETPDANKEGPNAALIRNPRAGVVTTRRGGLVIILVSSVDEGALESVLNSVH